MVTKTLVGTSYGEDGSVSQLYDYRRLSDDEKPTDASTNALCLVTNTGNFEYFDGTEWQPVGGGADASV